MNINYHYRFRAAAAHMHVHPIVFSSAFYSTTTTFTSFVIQQDTSNTAGRDAVISDAPGSMTPTGNNTRCSGLDGSMALTFYVTFPGEAGYCSLNKDQQYYLNIKGHLVTSPTDYIMSVNPQ